MRNKGITLIALVVTIIILLILAGITIGIATNGTGLFDKAKEARDEYQNAQSDEEMQIAKYSNEIDSYVVGDTRDNLPSTVLYPGGTKENPSTIDKDTRLEINNPYPGHNLNLKVEIFYNGYWGNPGWVCIYNNGGFGIIAEQYRNDTNDKIIVQSGSKGVIASSGSSSGHPFGELTSVPTTAILYRIIVKCVD